VFAKFLIVVIFILISIQAFQIVSVRSAFAQSSNVPPEDHPSPPEDEFLAHHPHPDSLAQAHAQAVAHPPPAQIQIVGPYEIR
jgi:hypothetical protein